MSAPLACLACGFEGWDVRMRLIQVPEAERRMVNVALSVNERHGQQHEFAYREVPEQYVREPRCRDVAACGERLATLELDAMASVAQDPDETALAAL